MSKLMKLTSYSGDLKSGNILMTNFYLSASQMDTNAVLNTELKVCYSSHDLNGKLKVCYPSLQSCNLSVKHPMTLIANY